MSAPPQARTARATRRGQEEGGLVTDYLARNAVAIGDVRALAGRLEPQSVQTIVTSPPYFGLRDYGTATWEGGDAACDHVAAMARNDTERETPGGRGGSFRGGTVQYRGTCGKCGAARVDKQLGMEATPDEFVANLVEVFAALRPALKAEGTMWVNLGDSYSGGGRGGHGAGLEGSPPQGIGNAYPPSRLVPGLPPKSLLMIPHRVALALQADGWVVRGDIVWGKPNPMPESVTDRPTRSHEYIFLIAKQPRYFYDAEAIAEESSQPIGIPRRTGQHKAGELGEYRGMYAETATSGLGTNQGAATRNKRDVWTLPSSQFAGAHFATMPLDLVRPCILAGTSERGECSACGRAWARCVEQRFRPMTDRSAAKLAKDSGRKGLDASSRWGGVPRGYSDSTTTGWAAQCRCGAPTRPQVVLDPFLGSGTVAQVCVEEGRDWLGIDLDARAVQWTADRLAKLPVGRLAGV